MEDHTTSGITTESTFINHGGFNGNIKANQVVLYTQIRSPWQLFKASVAITGAVLFTVGMVLFASRSLEYIKTFF